MEWLIIIGIIVWLIVSLTGRSAENKRQLNEVFERLGEVKRRFDRLERQIEIGVKAAAPPGVQPVREVSPAPVEKTMPFSQPAVSKQVAPNVPAPAPESLHCAPARPSPLEERWQRIEHTFIENWTGNLGHRGRRCGCNLHWDLYRSASLAGLPLPDDGQRCGSAGRCIGFPASP